MTETEAKAKALLEGVPMTRYTLQCKLQVSQAHTALILKSIGALVVGHERPHGKGNLSPIYAMEVHAAPAPPAPIGRVSSVWELGGRVRRFE